MIRTAWLTTVILASASFAMFGSARAGDSGVLHTHYDGVSNDLLTAGLGSGLGNPIAPVSADPLH